MPKLGKTQRSVLESLIRHGSWHPGCGWYWNTRSGTIRIMDSLANRGLATRTDPAWGPRFEPTDAGREAVGRR